MTRARIRIPTPLRAFVGGADEVVVEARTVGEALQRLAEAHAGIGQRVLDPEGQPRPFVNVYLGSEDVRRLQGLDTPLADGAVLAIVPAVAGGRA